MVSTRTLYRRKRIQLLGDAILETALLLLEQKQILERVHLKYFKSVRNSLDKLSKEVNRIKSLSHD